MAKDKRERGVKEDAKNNAAAVDPKYPKPPKTYTKFTKRFPELARAWELIHEGGEKAGPMDEKTRRLVKLGIAIGSRQTGPVHSSVRKALAMGITMEELEQVAALAAGTMGMSAGVAAFTWIHEEAEKR